MILDGIRKNSFVVFGRAGMDMFAGPAGTKSEDAETFRADLGGSSANICAGICKLGGRAALVTSVSDDAVVGFASIACGITVSIPPMSDQLVVNIGHLWRSTKAVWTIFKT